MAAGEALDILTQIQALVSDRLQVVSYKWLSRNFLVSSNYAKRLLQEFVDTQGNELEVIYTLSGWLKKNPSTYCIRLASRPNLAEVKQEFEDNSSVQVYSVQACIPNDLAVLWNAEFVQAEELFNQPSTAENCLRDNRFCGVSNSFVKRCVDGKPVGATFAQPKSIVGVAMTSPFQPLQGHAAQTSGEHKNSSSAAVTSSDKNVKLGPEVTDQSHKSHIVKESRTAIITNKKIGQNEKSISGNGGSLANLWGRASAKSKPLTPALHTSNDIQNVVVSADAQICACEAADAASSEDDEKHRRESNDRRSRKRKVIMDFSDDDDEEEIVVNLASPDPPNGTVRDAVNRAENVVLEKTSLNLEEQKEDAFTVRGENAKQKDSELLSNVDIKSESKSIHIDVSLEEKVQNHALEDVADKNRKDRSINSASTLPQKRKVLKTRIDERGREVTEVVWEGEAADNNAGDRDMITSDTGNRPPPVNKVAATGNSASSIPVSKVGNKKAAKGGPRDVKQGNILSFFKKI